MLTCFSAMILVSSGPVSTRMSIAHILYLFLRFSVSLDWFLLQDSVKENQKYVRWLFAVYYGGKRYYFLNRYLIKVVSVLTLIFKSCVGLALPVSFAADNSFLVLVLAAILSRSSLTVFLSFKFSPSVSSTFLRNTAVSWKTSSQIQPMFTVDLLHCL